MQKPPTSLQQLTPLIGEVTPGPITGWVAILSQRWHFEEEHAHHIHVTVTKWEQQVSQLGQSNDSVAGWAGMATSGCNSHLWSLHLRWNFWLRKSLRKRPREATLFGPKPFLTKRFFMTTFILLNSSSLQS